MHDILRSVLGAIRSSLSTRQDLALENLALRHQIGVLQRRAGKGRPALVPMDRCLWMGLSRLWASWRQALARDTRELIRRMSRANPLWGAPRITNELSKLGIEVSGSSVAKYMIRERKAPSPTWRVFLDNHVRDIVSVDFFVVPTATFRVLFGFLVLSHDRRRVVHFNLTSNSELPTWGSNRLSVQPARLGRIHMLKD